ncbi:MAG: hypothetical protein GXC76_05965 [Rhodanobacteraceae bacterium]|jgi:general secretion pathway protein L|nr:hypothetical protein [Rhodanobacteraceae bacterium]
MPDRLLLRLAPDGGLTWLRRAGDGRASAATQAGAPPAAVLACAAEVVVLVPAEDVLLTAATLKARSRAQLLQALPYAVEDRLLSPLEELHFAAARTAGDEVGVAVVAKATLRGWLERLAAAGIRPDVVIPESLALAADAATTPVLLEDARALVRLAPWSAFACSLAELPNWLAQAAGALAPLAVHDVRAAASTLALPPPVASQRRHAPDALAFFAASLDGAPGKESLNLLDGEFAPRHRRARGLRSGRLAAALAAAVVVLAVAGLGADVLRLTRTSARLDALAQDAVRGAFPDLDPAQFARLTPEQLMQGRLDRLRGGSESAGLLRVLGQVGPVLASTTRMQTRGLEYRNGTLELSLRVADVAALDSVRERLATVPGVTAEVTAANPGADGVDGRIRVGGGAR